MLRLTEVYMSGQGQVYYAPPLTPTSFLTACLSVSLLVFLHPLLDEDLSLALGHAALLSRAAEPAEQSATSKQRSDKEQA